MFQKSVPHSDIVPCPLNETGKVGHCDLPAVSVVHPCYPWFYSCDCKREVLFIRTICKQFHHIAKYLFATSIYISSTYRGNLQFSIHLKLLLLNQMLTSQHLEIYQIKIYDFELNSLYHDQDRELREIFSSEMIKNSLSVFSYTYPTRPMSAINLRFKSTVLVSPFIPMNPLAGLPPDPPLATINSIPSSSRSPKAGK